MKRFLISLLVLFSLTSCNFNTSSEKITHLWTKGIITAEYENSAYRAEVNFNANELTFDFVEPHFLNDVSFRVNENSVVLLNDNLSLNYDHLKGFMTEFYSVVRNLNYQELQYSSQDDSYISEFTADNKLCKIVIDKKTNNVIHFEMPYCVFSVKQEVT